MLHTKLQKIDKLSMSKFIWDWQKKSMLRLSSCNVISIIYITDMPFPAY